MPTADPSPAPAHQRLAALSAALLHLHKRLLDSETALYDRDIARVTSPNQLLGLVLNDPAFSWLRELSQLVVVIDEALDSKIPLTQEDATRLIALTRSLLVPAEHGDGFHRRYYEAFQRDPDTVLAHADMMKVLANLG